MTSVRSSRALTWGAGLLITVGVVTALMRYLLPRALHLTVAAPLYGSYASEQLPVLAKHPVAEAAHRLGGAIYFILGALQFSSKIRARRVVHRWVGRAFLGLALIAALSGIVLGVLYPYQPGERLPAVIFGSLLLVFGLQGWLAVRRGDILAHREWMTRCFAVGLGIGTIRLIAVVCLHTTPFGARDLIVPAFWIGWSATLLVAELWIRGRRPAARAAASLDAVG